MDCVVPVRGSCVRCRNTIQAWNCSFFCAGCRHHCAWVAKPIRAYFVINHRIAGVANQELCRPRAWNLPSSHSLVASYEFAIDKWRADGGSRGCSRKRSRTHCRCALGYWVARRCSLARARRVTHALNRHANRRPRRRLRATSIDSSRGRSVRAKRPTLIVTRSQPACAQSFSNTGSMLLSVPATARRSTTA